MKKNTLKKILCLPLAALLFHSTAIANSTQKQSKNYEYFNSLNQFGKLTDYQMSTFKEFINSNPNISNAAADAIDQSLKVQSESLWTEITRLNTLYSKIFIKKTATKQERKDLVFYETRLSIAVHRDLLLVQEFLKKTNKGSSSLTSNEALRLSKQLNEITYAVKNGQSVNVPTSMGINQVFQSSKNLTSSICNLLLGFCSRKSLSQLMDSLDESKFLRTSEYKFEGVEKVKQTLDTNRKSVIILIGNHDQPLMDIALGRKAALLMGSDQHITMTRKSVYPIPPPTSPGDIVFVIDNDPKSNPVQESLDLVTKHILSKDKNTVSLAVYPEGMLPYTGGQMPMTTKEGAFIIARKLAHKMSQEGVDVYLVRMKTNIIEHLTSTTEIPASVRMESVEKVPDNPIDKSIPDPWIEQKRLEAENSFNSHRGKSQIDVFNLDKVPSSKIPYGLEMKKCSMVFIL